MVWDIKVNGLNMTELIVSFSNNNKERNMPDTGKSQVILGKNDEKSGHILCFESRAIWRFHSVVRVFRPTPSNHGNRSLQ